MTECAMCMQLENKNINNAPVPFTSYMARFRTPYQQSKSTTPLYYSWNLAGKLCWNAHSTLASADLALAAPSRYRTPFMPLCDTWEKQ